MAHRIIYKPSNILVSSALGGVGIQVDGTYCDVTLTASDGIVILSERYYAYDGKVTIYDLASLIEAEMRKSGCTYAEFKLSVFTDTSSNKADSHIFHILYCDRFSVCSDVLLFLKENFLTTLSNRRVTDSSTLSLFLFAKKDENLEYTVQYRFKCTNLDASFCHSMTMDTGKIAHDTGVAQINVSVSMLIADAASFASTRSSEIQIQSFTVRCGQRSITCFVDRSLSDANTFIFRNCFNVFDFVYLPMQNTAKTDVERSIAVINGHSSFYNQSTNKKYEVVIGPLTSDEADWIDQLFTSYDVFRFEPNDCDDSETIVLTKVMITDINCEISDSDEKPNTAKFIWRYSNNRAIIRFSASRGIFTSPFDYRFY